MTAEFLALNILLLLLCEFVDLGNKGQAYIVAVVYRLVEAARYEERQVLARLHNAATLSRIPFPFSIT